MKTATVNGKPVRGALDNGWREHTRRLKKKKKKKPRIKLDTLYVLAELE